MEPIFSLVPLVVFLPVIGLLLNLLVGKRLGEKRHWHHRQSGLWWRLSSRRCWRLPWHAAARPAGHHPVGRLD